jgi:hypothetical protein
MTTCQPDFAGVRIKVERAKHHFRDLQSRYEGFQEAKPYRVVVDDEADTGDLVHRVEVSDQPPLFWSAIAGDCVHNLRSSLDLLVCEMVRAEGERVTDQTGFPIFKSANAFKSGHHAKVKGTPKAAVDLIKKAEPYQGADNPFWRLHQLDIADKHILLVPVGVVHQRTISKYDLNQLFAAMPGVRKFTMADVAEEAIGIITPSQVFPLKDDAEIRRIPARLRDHPVAQLYMDPEFVFGVAFGEVEVVEGQPLIPTLDQMIQFVEGFIKLFPPLFRQESSW